MDEDRYRRAEAALWASVGATPSERHVALPSTGTSVRVQQVGEGPPALLLHGGPNAGATFVPLIPDLRGRRLLLVDRPGCGLSEPYPLDVTNTPDFADRFAVEVLDGLGIEVADLIASSFGGYLAFRAAAASPGRFRSIVALGCPAFVPGMAMPPMVRMLASPLRHLVLRLPTTRRATVATLRQLGHRASLAADRFPPSLITWFLALQAHTGTFRNEAAMIAALSAPRRGFDPALELDAAVLDGVSQPTLLVWGDRDPFGGPAIATAFREALPDATLETVADGGHLPWLDDVPGVAALIEAHLAGERLSPA